MSTGVSTTASPSSATRPSASSASFAPGSALRERILSTGANLASTAALEHFTATIAEVLLRDEEARRLVGAPEVLDVLLWHAVEECEHKAVAFDVYRAMGGSERTRVMVMNATIVGFTVGMTLQLLVSLARDPAARERGRLVESREALAPLPVPAALDVATAPRLQPARLPSRRPRHRRPARRVAPPALRPRRPPCRGGRRRMSAGDVDSGAEHLDVVVVGAGLSGIDAGHHLQATAPWAPLRHPRGTRRHRRYVGPVSATPASGRTPTCTPSASRGVPGTARRPSPPAPRSSSISRVPLAPKASIVASGSDNGWWPRRGRRPRRGVDPHRGAGRRRRAPRAHVRVPVQLHGLLPLRPRTHTDLAGRRRLPR